MFQDCINDKTLYYKLLFCNPSEKMKFENPQL
jgi:hypothetical protein